MTAHSIKARRERAAGKRYGPYGVILADPPWSYNKKIGQGIASERYDVMPLADIKALPVRDLAAKDCALCMWATGPFLMAAGEVGVAWGFRYVTKLFCWEKINADGSSRMGLGHYARTDTEDCLLFVRGNVLPVADPAVQQTIRALVREHSQKPDQTYCRIERLWPAARKVELFARQHWPNWEQAMSNQATLRIAAPFLMPEAV